MIRDCGCGFMQRTRGEAGSEAGVELERAVQRRTWFRRRLDSSIATEADRRAAMLVKQLCSLRRGAVGSRAVGGWRVAGWREIRSCGCARSRVAADGARIGAETPRHPES